MSKTQIDPNLIGIWLLPGEQQTYEITETGDYLIGEPEEPLKFEDGSRLMTWGARRFRRADSDGIGLIGTWIEAGTGDAWDFADGQELTILTADETLITGIWALRDRGRCLWHCEKHATLNTDGAHLEFRFSAGDRLRYGYTVTGDVLSLLDPASWTELTRYISSTLYLETVAS